jgi:hypothetical protein
MDDRYWNSGNDSFNYTGDFQYCEVFLGDIVAWSLTVYLSIIVIATIANVLLLFAIHKDPLKCFRNPTTYFIANLGIADLLNSLFHFEELLVSQTTYNSTFCLPGSWKTFHAIFGGFIYSLTFPSVTVLALERYVSIAHPLWHQVNVTSRLCCTWIAVVWIINCVYAGITARFFNISGLLIGYPSVFYLTTVFLYLLAFLSIRKQTSSLETDNSKSGSNRRMIKLRLRNQNRFLTTVLIINIFLTFGVTPTLIGLHLKHALEWGTTSTSVAVLFYTSDILFLINIASNPFLYIWRLPKYRRTFLAMYCRKK